jgi:hypothetical protein
VAVETALTTGNASVPLDLSSTSSDFLWT